MIRAAFTPISKSTSLQDDPGQPVWYRYNSRSGLSVPHEYNNISAGLGWPMWIGFLSTWVVRMVRENSIERCGRAVGSPRLMVDEDKEGDGCGQSLKEV